MYGEQEGTMPHFYLKSPFISHEFVCTWPFYFKFTASTVPPQISWVCNTWFISLPVIYTFYSEALHVQNIRRVKLQALRPLVYVSVEMERSENTTSFENAFYLAIPFVSIPFSRVIPPMPIVSFFSEEKNW